MYNTEEFIRRARLVHGDKYNYSKVEYVNSQTKVCIICPIHGEFLQTPDDHLQGHGCIICGYYNAGNNVLSTNDFILRAREVHGDKYDYSKTKYNGIYQKICIICPKHGEFKQKPIKHIIGQGCPICAQELCYSETRLFEELKKLLPQYSYFSA